MRAPRDRATGRPHGAPADRGSVTAELAVALPAVVVLAAVLIWGLQLAAEQVRLQDGAALAARALGRGEAVPSTGRAAGAELTSWRDGELVCARLGRAATGPLGVRVELAAASCALDGGR